MVGFLSYVVPHSLYGSVYNIGMMIEILPSFQGRSDKNCNLCKIEMLACNFTLQFCYVCVNLVYFKNIDSGGNGSVDRVVGSSLDGLGLMTP